MKRFILSTFVMASFGFYVVWQNMNNSSNTASMPVVVVNTPTITKKNPAPKPTTVTPTPTTNNPKPTPTPTPVIIPPKPSGIYKDGTYVGISADAYYGYIQVKAIIANGKLVDVIFLDHPQDRRTSIQINNYAMPILKSEAIKAQSASVNTVSGATDSSGAFRESLASALAQAKV